MNWNIVSAEVVCKNKLKVKFRDGLEGFVDFMPSFFNGVFRNLKNARSFAQVFIENGTVSWPGDLDLAPDALYREIKSNGVCLLK